RRSTARCSGGSRSTSQKLSRPERVRIEIDPATGQLRSLGGRMKIKRAFLAPLTIAAVALASGGWLLQRGASREGNVYTQARLFDEVLHHISEKYVDAKDPTTLYRMAIDGLIYELGDPHTAFMTPKDYEELKVQTQG